MKQLRSSSLVFIALAACLGLPSGVYAASTWQFTSGPSATKTGSGSDPNLSSFVGVYAANGGTFNGSATTGGSTGLNYYGISGFAANAAWTLGSVGYSSGSGLTMSSDGSSSPNHAFDNGPKTNSYGTFVDVGNTEALLLNFSDSVILNGINVGWTGTSPNNDTDISLFRYTGATTPTLPGVKADGTSMANAGWQLVSNYTDLTVDTMVTINSASNLGSSWWLISAYNQSYGGNFTQGNDFMKIFAVAGTACTSQVAGVCRPGTSTGTPEPASLALVAIGLLGVFGVNRRRLGVGAR